MRIGIFGPGRSGKDVAADFFRDRCGLRYAGTTSVVISADIARIEGRPFDEVHAERHARREEWRRHGDVMREHDPAALAREVLKDGDLCVGVRAECEIDAVIDENLVDIRLWIDRPFLPDGSILPPDPTLEFGAEKCHVIVPNWWGVPEYLTRLEALARSWGLDPT